MQRMKFNRDEQETVITFDANKERGTFYSYVPSQRVQKALQTNL